MLILAGGMDYPSACKVVKKHTPSKPELLKYDNGWLKNLALEATKLHTIGASIYPTPLKQGLRVAYGERRVDI